VDLERLIEEVTELVFRQLAVAHGNGGVAGGTAAVVPLETAAARIAQEPVRVLMVMSEGRRTLDALAAQLRLIADCASHLTIVPCGSFSRLRVEALLPQGGAMQVDFVEKPPPSWDALVRDSRVLLVPNISLNALSGISLLAGLEPCAQAAVQAFIEGRPVVAGCEDINFLTMNAAHLAKPFLEILRQRVSAVQSLGVRLVEMKQLGAEVGKLCGSKASLNGSAGRGRNVLTREDVETLLRAGHRSIEVAGGTIVTPLALEVAKSAGIVIEIR
jgi:hypothetical protein